MKDRHFGDYKHSTKVYMLYLKRNGKLYAYSYDKKRVKEFLNQRDKKSFNLVTLDATKLNFSDLGKTIDYIHENKDSEIVTELMTTVTTKGKYDTINVMVTMEESYELESAMNNIGDIFEAIDDDADKSLIKSMNVFGFDKKFLQKLKSNSTDNYWDEFSVFINIFAHTFDHNIV